MKLEIGIRIRELRKIIGLTQTQLAKQIKTTQDTVSLWERGKSYPNVESIILLCTTFNVSADYLLGLTDF